MCGRFTGRVTGGLAACLIGTLCIGCSTNPGTIRGQNPNFTAVPPQSALQPAGYQQMPPSPYALMSAAYAAGPQSGSYGCPNCNDGSCGLCGQRGAQDWSPTHYHWFKYQPPRNLVYPPANQPAGVVMYPYYTVKGPDDFFAK